ncbi:MAG: hypothetical protein ACOH2M_10640 [Cypionkella sp.]
MADGTMTGRREAIAAAISAELQRQGVNRVDVTALTEAVEAAIPADLPVSEGRHPDQLNATNDD